jgi:hypothetical protein
MPWKDFKSGTSIDLSKTDMIVCRVKNRGGLSETDNSVNCIVYKDGKPVDEDYTLYIRKGFDGFVIKENKIYLAGEIEDWKPSPIIKDGWFTIE